MDQESNELLEPRRKFEIKVSKLEGSPASEHGRFVQVFEFIPPEGEEFPKDRGRFYAVIDLTVDSKSDASLAAKLVWSSLTGGYYDPSGETPIKALEEATYAARERLQDFSPESSLNLLVVGLWGDIAYFARIGKPVLYLRRGSAIRNLLSDDESIDIGSQLLEKDDVLIMGSPVFGKNFTTKSLPQTEFLEKQFDRGEVVPGFAALLLRIESSKEEREVEVKKAKSSRLFKTKVLRGVSTLRKRVAKAISEVNVKSLSVSKTRASVESALSKSVSRGEELAKSKKNREEKVDESREPVTVKKGKFPKIPLPFGREILPRLILILVVLFVISISFTTFRQAQKARAEEFDRLVASASSSLAEAEGLIGLSNERAKELLDGAQDDLASADSLFAESEEIDPLLSKADTLFNAIEKITPVEDKHLVYDLGLKVEGAAGLAISGSGSTVYVIDKTSKSLFAIKLGDLPQVSILGEGKLADIKELVYESGYLYILAEKTTYRLRLSSKKIDEPIIFEKYAKAEAIDTYLGNIYLLAPSEDQIYKFWNLAVGYSGAVSWVTGAVDFSSVVDFAIDGELWFVDAQGEIIRMSKGKKETFAISNLSTPFGDLIKIFTRFDVKQLYVLDRGNQRVVVLDKNGDFVRQFKGDVLSDLKDLWVPDNEKSLYILSGSKIYKVEL